MMDTVDMMDHIIWTVEKSPQAYRLLRKHMCDLRAALVNAELTYQQEERDGNQESNPEEGQA